MTEPIPFPTPEHAPDDLTCDELSGSFARYFLRHIL